MENKQNRRALIDPIRLVLKSRRVLIALVSLIVGLVMLSVPQLEPLHKEILTLILSLALTLIGGLSVEDAVIAARKVPAEADIRKQVEKAMEAIIDEAFNEMETALWYSGNIEDAGPDGSPN